VLAVVLPELACELAEAQLELEQTMSSALTEQSEPRAAGGSAMSIPLAVVLAPSSASPGPVRLPRARGATLGPETPLHAVNVAAAAVGLYRGQSLGRARAARRALVVFSVSAQAIEEALARLADLLRQHAGQVSFEAPDTIWLEPAVVGPLGEEALAEEVQRSFAAFGHRASVAVADGPWLARAFASFGEPDRSGVRVVSSNATEAALLALPVIALPLTTAARLELSRQGALTIADLRALPAATLAQALLCSDVPRPRRVRQRQASVDPGPWPTRRRSAGELLALVRGRDRTTLVPQPPAPLEEALACEPGSSKAAVLDIMLTQLCKRLAARLAGRQAAALELALLAHTARSGEPLRMISRPRAPAWSRDELLAAVRPRLRDLVDGEDVRVLALQVVRTAPARASQAHLAFAEPSSVPVDGVALGRLLGELEQRVGPAALGIAAPTQRRGERRAERPQLPVLSNPRGLPWSHGVPTRWLNTPLPLTGPLERDQIVVLGSQAYVIRARHFEGRSTSPGEHRDYFRLWLAELDDGSAHGVIAGVTRRGVEALVYRDGRGSYLQAFFD
jgi:hypothetical protein